MAKASQNITQDRLCDVVLVLTVLTTAYFPQIHLID